MDRIQPTPLGLSPFYGRIGQSASAASQLNPEKIIQDVTLAQKLIGQSGPTHGFLFALMRTPTQTSKQISEEELAIRLKAAADPKTDPNLLEEWSKEPDVNVRKEVAKNPNSSLMSLDRLGVEYPELVLENPCISLLLLANTSLILEKFSPFTVVAFARASQDESKLALFAHHPNTWVQWAVLENPKTSPVIRNRLWEVLSQSSNQRLLQALANSPSAPPAVIEKLSVKKNELDRVEKDTNHESLNIAQRAALSPYTPEHLIRQFGRDRDWRIRKYAAQNPNMPIDLMEELANDEHCGVREGIGKNPSTPLVLLKILYEDAEAEVAIEVHYNPRWFRPF